MFVIYPYNMTSMSARLLRDSFREDGVRSKLVWPDRNYRGRPHHKVLVWGNSTIPNWWDNISFQNRINSPQLVASVVNKLSFYNMMEGLVPAFTTSREEAQEWGCSVIARHILNGREGRGCEFVPAGEQLPDAPLYSAYFRSVREYRVHVITCGNAWQIMDKQEKRRVNGENANRRVRSHDNGWIFARENVNLPNGYVEVLEDAVSRLPLHHAHHNILAIDLIYSQRNGLRVLEANTAPGIEGTTRINYYNVLKEI